VVSSTPRLHFTPGKDPVPILQEVGWAPGPVWTEVVRGGTAKPATNSRRFVYTMYLRVSFDSLINSHYFLIQNSLIGFYSSRTPCAFRRVICIVM